MFAANPFLGGWIEALYKSAGVAGNYAVIRKTFGYDSIRANDAILTEYQLAFTAKNHATIAKPGIPSDGDAPAGGHALRMNRPGDVGILVVVVHHQDRRREQDIFLEPDLISGGDGGAATDFAPLAKNQFGSALQIFENDIYPNIRREKHLFINFDMRRVWPPNVAGMMDGRAGPKFHKRIGLPEPLSMNSVSEARKNTQRILARPLGSGSHRGASGFSRRSRELGRRAIFFAKQIAEKRATFRAIKRTGFC
jgi:hypothetical protein